MKINEFLKNVASDMKRTDRELRSEEFYYILKYVGVKKNSSLVNEIDKFYQEFLESLNNSLVKYEEKTVKSGDNATHYLGLYVDKIADYKEAVKVYFPVKYEYVISALKTVFLYLVRNSVKCQVKFHVKATNEGIVIRFYQKSDALPFINYCQRNFVLNDLLVHNNPFIATVYGIGLVYDNNIKNTYNGTLSVLLESYFKNRKVNNLLDKCCDLDFLDFVRKRKDEEIDELERFNIMAIERNIMALLNNANAMVEKDLI